MSLTIKLAPMIQWTKRSDVAVHQVFEDRTDLENALHNADRDGFECIVLYVTKGNSIDKVRNYVEACVPSAEVYIVQDLMRQIPDPLTDESPIDMGKLSRYSGKTVLSFRELKDLIEREYQFKPFKS